ncbi:RHS repeat-associated core domain protein [Bacteriovorax sp. BAL6_X]|uniref:RHS repeat-associated core domain-containing protein n=1 Tax=Bacteriovorax sp. BAL6_X TaxID=1201290 RepID=UPI00038610FD|nr:RHS repeat-associated core domain-containing protein [Bacteriovorax sp. BAL6_X]EPZ51488.1 RHS repeat-associated core domain protein [Bacteriovorax sp. BAL6_X]
MINNLNYSSSRTRNYNPGLGRFMSEDPIGLSSLDTNLYRYTKNRPIDFNDPDGEFLGKAAKYLLEKLLDSLKKKIVKKPLDEAKDLIFNEGEVVTHEQELEQLKKKLEDAKRKEREARKGCGVIRSCEPKRTDTEDEIRKCEVRK